MNRNPHKDFCNLTCNKFTPLYTKTYLMQILGSILTNNYEGPPFNIMINSSYESICSYGTSIFIVAKSIP